MAICHVMFIFCKDAISCGYFHILPSAHRRAQFYHHFCNQAMSSVVPHTSVERVPQSDTANTRAIDARNAVTLSGEVLPHRSPAAPSPPQPLPPLTEKSAFVDAQKGIHAYILAEPHSDADGLWDVSRANEWIQNQPVINRNYLMPTQSLIFPL
jgi:hypothetical protein